MWHKPRLLQVESYAMLATLQFLHHYITYWHLHPSSSDKEHYKYTHSDNLLRHPPSIDQYYPPPPGACMTLEYNLDAAILKSLLEAIPLSIICKYIKMSSR
jgi:hypothetical protein